MMEFFHEFLNFHFVRSFSKELHFSLFCQNVSETNLSETFVSKIFFLENIEICFFRIFFMFFIDVRHNRDLIIETYHIITYMKDVNIKIRRTHSLRNKIRKK